MRLLIVVVAGRRILHHLLQLLRLQEMILSQIKLLHIRFPVDPIGYLVVSGPHCHSNSSFDMVPSYFGAGISSSSCHKII